MENGSEHGESTGKPGPQRPKFCNNSIGNVETRIHISLATYIPGWFVSSALSVVYNIFLQKSFCSRAPQFGGTNQHDAQEFLSTLLDGLHEDLNRVLQKPIPLTITPEREAELEKMPPQIASAQEWSTYNIRNDSLVVDYFQGQFRNRLQCLTCQHVSS